MGNPIALLGLIGVAVPVLIHLLARQRARVQKFPSLRFLTASPLLPTRRTAITDLPILLVRCAIIVAACLALGQPSFSTHQRREASEGALSRTIARVIIVDTSASMHRPTLNGGEAIAQARSDAAALSAGATARSTIETAYPGEAIQGASSWLSSQAGRRELVIVSDFQIGALDSLDLSAIPDGVGVKLVAVGIADASSAVAIAGTRITANTPETTAEWAAMPSGRRPSVQLLFADKERARVEAAASAAEPENSGTYDSTRRIRFVDESFPGRAALLDSARTVDTAWMGDIAATLRGDAMLAAVTANAAVARGQRYPAPLSVILSNRLGEPVVLMSQGAGKSLDVWMAQNAGDIAVAAVLRVLNSPASAAPVREAEPASLARDRLSSWERVASTRGTRLPEPESDGRWLWLAALVFLGLEAWMRRAPRRTPAADASVSSDVDTGERAA